jgi:hypothetical protein
MKSHTNCKAYYLIGVFGGASMAQLMFNGRHDSVKHALTYFKDADAQFELAKANNMDVRAKVPRFKAFRIIDLSLTAILNAPSLPHQRPLHVLAKHYCEQLLQFPKVYLGH